MDRLLEKIKIPKYSILPLGGMLALNCLVYFGTRPFTENLYHHNMSLKLDEMLPLVSIFILPYVLAYVQWITGYIMIAKVSKEHCYYVMTGEMIAKLITGICFVLYPTTIVRPEIIPQNFLSQLVDMIYKADAPNNLFPSVHCLESWFCLRGCWNQKCFSKTYKYSMFIMTVLVFLSTVFVKQHVVLDMVGAVAVGELGLFLSRSIYLKIRN